MVYYSKWWILDDFGGPILRNTHIWQTDNKMIDIDQIKHPGRSPPTDHHPWVPYCCRHGCGQTAFASMYNPWAGHFQDDMLLGIAHEFRYSQRKCSHAMFSGIAGQCLWIIHATGLPNLPNYVKSALRVSEAFVDPNPPCAEHALCQTVESNWNCGGHTWESTGTIWEWVDENPLSPNHQISPIGIN